MNGPDLPGGQTRGPVTALAFAPFQFRQRAAHPDQDDVPRLEQRETVEHGVAR